MLRGSRLGISIADATDRRGKAQISKNKNVSAAETSVKLCGLRYAGCRIDVVIVAGLHGTRDTPTYDSSDGRSAEARPAAYLEGKGPSRVVRHRLARVRLRGARRALVAE